MSRTLAVGHLRKGFGVQFGFRVLGLGFRILALGQRGLHGLVAQVSSKLFQ